MIRYVGILVALVATSSLADASTLPHDGCAVCVDGACYGSDSGHACGCRKACCCEACVSVPEEGTEEKHCWKIECDKVCVPAVRFPWEPGGSPLTCFNWLKKHGDAGCCDTCGSQVGGCNCGRPAPICGRVRCVRDLKKEKYKVDVCQWKWEIRRLPPCGCRSGNQGCTACRDGLHCGD